jgi:seryl-tRNA synthetase
LHKEYEDFKREFSVDCLNGFNQILIEKELKKLLVEVDEAIKSSSEIKLNPTQKVDLIKRNLKLKEVEKLKEQLKEQDEEADKLKRELNHEIELFTNKSNEFNKDLEALIPET